MCAEHLAPPVAPPMPLEREGEMESIRRVLADSSAGHGRLLVIEGPSGIGKSRLMEAARNMAEAQGMDVLQARGGELETDYAFSVVLRLFESRLSRASAVEREHVFRNRAVLAEPLLVRGNDETRRATPTDEFALLHGLYWCVVNLGEQRPVALLVDDAHWADDLSLRFLIYIAQRLADLPVALVVVVTTGDPAAESDLVRRLSAAASLALRPPRLSVRGVRTLFAAEGLEALADPDFVQASWETTGGNPFLLTELITAIKADPSGWDDGGAGQVSAFAPHSVRRSLMLRITRLGADALALARACSVLGEETPLLRATELASLGPTRGLEVAEALISAGVLAGIDPVSFAHPMIRAAVYGELAAGERSSAHLAAARSLHRGGAPPDEVATHLLLAPPHPEPWCRDALHDGARAAARKGAPRTAVRYLRRALEICPPEERTAGMLIDLGLLEAAAGKTTSLSRFEDALGMIDAPPERARALYALGQTLYRYGRHADAAQTFRRGAELFEPRDPEEALAFEAAYMCAATFVAPAHGAAMARLEAVVEARNGAGEDTVADRVLLANLAVRRIGTQPGIDGHAELIRRALGDGALLRAETSDSMAVNIAIAGLIFCERLDDALRTAESELADARARGAALAFAEASMMRAMVMHARGHITDAMADAQTAIDGMEYGWQGHVPIPQALLAHCLIERGELDVADEVLRAVEPILPGPDTTYLNTWFHWARGRLRLLQSRPREALTDFLEVERDLAPYGRVSPGFAPWRSLAGLAAHVLGQELRGLGLIDEEIRLSRAFELPIRLGAALRIRANVVAVTEQMPLLRESVEVLEQVDAPLELARTLHDLGRFLRHGGSRVASREPLLRALDLAHRCGANGLEARVRDELRASGARPRRVAITGVDALTPSERRIANLAAAGGTNRSIAEGLFLTKNTVEWHLRNVYRKLDVSSRQALGARLAKHDRMDPGAAG